MKHLKVDLGMEEYQLNDGGVLRFNPSDVNLYERFLGAVEKLEEMDAELKEMAQHETDGGEKLLALRKYDIRVKAVLAEVFGAHNDFDAILCGVNVMAIAANSKRVIANLMDALLPVVEAGAKKHSDDAADAELQKAAANRAARRAVKR